MGYTIKQVSERMNLPVSTLRYYDKMGLLPGLERKESGYRVFSDGDIEMLKIIDAFKKAGLQIKDMQNYLALAYKGESTLEERYQIFTRQEKVLEEKMGELQQALAVTRKKISYYEAALQAGTEAALPPAFCMSKEQK